VVTRSGIIRAGGTFNYRGSIISADPHINGVPLFLHYGDLAVR
jgi:hypothetical protein